MSRDNSRDRDSKSQKKLFLGNLSRDVEEQDVKDLFGRYGKINEIKIKKKGPNCYGFIEFDDQRDAKDALKENNQLLKGKEIRLEFGNGGRKKRNEGCYTCGSLNHIAKDCSKTRRTSSNSNNKNRCYNCGSTSHKVRDCHQSRRSRSRDRRRRSSRSDSRRRQRSRSEDRSRRRRDSRSDSRDRRRRRFSRSRSGGDRRKRSNERGDRRRQSSPDNRRGRRSSNSRQRRSSSRSYERPINTRGGNIDRSNSRASHIKNDNRRSSSNHNQNNNSQIPNNNYSGNNNNNNNSRSASRHSRSHSN